MSSRSIQPQAHLTSSRPGWNFARWGMSGAPLRPRGRVFWSRGIFCGAMLTALSCSEHVSLQLFAGTGASSGQAGAPSEEPPLIPDTPLAPPLVVEGLLDLSETNTGERSCADGGDIVSYVIEEISAAQVLLESSPSSSCLEPGDEVLLIDLQGTAESWETVGQHELLRVREISGKSVRFVSPVLQKYPASFLQDPENGHRLVLQRVPNYSSLRIQKEGVLTARAWDGERGGVLALRVVGDAVIQGELEMTAKGFRGGSQTEEPATSGKQGESLVGLGARQQTAHQGGGGGGIGDQMRAGCQQDGNPGGGGGHRTPGQNGWIDDLCEGVGVGQGGKAIARAGRLFLGSGGGSGGSDNIRVDNPPGGAGGRGGGIIWLLAQSVSGSGAILAGGEDGEGDPPGEECLGGSTVRCFDHSGPGGAGAGGSIRLNAPNILGLQVSAPGGRGGNGNDTLSGNGGDGGDGVIELQ